MNGLKEAMRPALLLVRGRGGSSIGICREGCAAFGDHPEESESRPGGTTGDVTVGRGLLLGKLVSALQEGNAAARESQGSSWK